MACNALKFPLIFLANDKALSVGYFPEAPAMEDHCLNLCLYVDSRDDVWTIPAVLFPGI